MRKDKMFMVMRPGGWYDTKGKTCLSAHEIELVNAQAEKIFPYAEGLKSIAISSSDPLAMHTADILNSKIGLEKEIFDILLSDLLEDLNIVTSYMYDKLFIKDYAVAIVVAHAQIAENLLSHFCNSKFNTNMVCCDLGRACGNMVLFNRNGSKDNEYTPSKIYYMGSKDEGY